MDIKIQHYFDAAHQLPDSEDLVSKGCATLHGHTYKVIVEAYGEPRASGMLIDFKAVKQTIDRLDHAPILLEGNQHINALHNEFLDGKVPNDVVVLSEPPTAENIAKYIYNQLESMFVARNLFNLVVSVCEGYKGEDKANWVVYEGASHGPGIISTLSIARVGTSPSAAPHTH